MALGHERCGAVTATVGAKGKSTGSVNIDAIVKTIAPNIKNAAKDCDACKGEKNVQKQKKMLLLNVLLIQMPKMLQQA